jgi:sugar O-acyltransferase (sialic acid O-acetyltransferase NeuD family)
MILAEILVPLLNANEPEARLVGIHAADGEAIEQGRLLFTLETTKAAAEVLAPRPGILRLLAKEGDTLSVGTRLAVLMESANEPIQTGGAPVLRAMEPAGLRMTRPARALAFKLGVSLDQLPLDRLVTEEVVRTLAGSVPSKQLVLPRSDKPLIAVYGGGGHGKTLMDLIRQLQVYTIAGIVDDEIPAGSSVSGIPVLGSGAILTALVAQGVRLAANGVGGLIDIQLRVRIFELLAKAGLECPSLIHPRATVEASAQVADGVQVFANAYVGSEAVLSPDCMVNTNAVVSHDCSVGSYSHIAPGALLAGHVQVGDKTLIGMGVTTTVGVHIGARVRVGNGAVIFADVPDRAILPAGKVWSGINP